MRVHWVYTTTGAMLWVLVRSLLSLVYAAAHKGESVDWVGIFVTWVVVAAYCASNVMLLRVMHLRSMVRVFESLNEVEMPWSCWTRL